MLQATSFQPLL